MCNFLDAPFMPGALSLPMLSAVLNARKMLPLFFIELEIWGLVSKRNLQIYNLQFLHEPESNLFCLWLFPSTLYSYYDEIMFFPLYRTLRFLSVANF